MGIFRWFGAQAPWVPHKRLADCYSWNSACPAPDRMLILHFVHFLQIGGGGISVSVFNLRCLCGCRHRRISCERLAEKGPISCSCQLLDQWVPELYFSRNMRHEGHREKGMRAVSGVMERKRRGANNKLDGWGGVRMQKINVTKYRNLHINFLNPCSKKVTTSLRSR